MLSPKQKQVTAKELQKNYEMLSVSKEQVLNDLVFTEGQLKNALHVEGSNGYDVWKLRDYLFDKLKEEGKEMYPFSILKINVWYQYDKTWR